MLNDSLRHIKSRSLELDLLDNIYTENYYYLNQHFSVDDRDWYTYLFSGKPKRDIRQIPDWDNYCRKSGLGWAIDRSQIGTLFGGIRLSPIVSVVFHKPGRLAYGVVWTLAIPLIYLADMPSAMDSSAADGTTLSCERFAILHRTVISSVRQNTRFDVRDLDRYFQRTVIYTQPTDLPDIRCALSFKWLSPAHCAIGIDQRKLEQLVRDDPVVARFYRYSEMTSSPKKVDILLQALLKEFICSRKQSLGFLPDSQQTDRGLSVLITGSGKEAIELLLMIADQISIQCLLHNLLLTYPTEDVVHRLKDVCDLLQTILGSQQC